MYIESVPNRGSPPAILLRESFREACRAGRIVLASAARHSAQAVAQSVGVSGPTVRRWQQRFAESGVEGLLRDKTRKPRKAPIAAEITAQVVALTCTEPPHQATHWTGRAMAKATGISWVRCSVSGGRTNCSRTACAPSNARAIPACRQAHRHRRALYRSAGPCRGAVDRRKEPNPSARPHPTGTADQARALSDPDAGLQAAALSVLDGTVIGRCMQRRRHVEFIRFLNAVEREVMADKPIHVVLDNYATHKHPKVLAWLARRPRWTFHFTPTSASWLNTVENFFSKMTRQRIRRGVFRSIADLQAAINAYLAEHNASPKPFVWTKSADAILAKLQRCPEPSV